MSRLLTQLLAGCYTRIRKLLRDFFKKFRAGKPYNTMVVGFLKKIFQNFLVTERRYLILRALVLGTGLTERR